MQTYLKVMNFQNAGQVHHVDVVSQNKSFLLIVFHAIHGLCVFSLSISLMIIMRICVIYLIIIIRSEVGAICHCLRFGKETVVCAVCLSLFLWTQTFSRSFCHLRYNTPDDLYTTSSIWNISSAVYPVH